MRILRQPEELQRGRKVCLAIGMFDGVHLGHQQVIRQAVTDARPHDGLAVAVTFDRHPNSIVAPERTPPLIYSLNQKLRVIESLGVDATLLIEFDEKFSRKAGETFVRELISGFGQVRSVCVGSEFAFGHQRSGKVDLLRNLGSRLNFSVHGIAAVALDGQMVSSTRIRERIRAGDLDAASQMLGRAYSVAGKVTAGDGLGRKLGFPTANVDITGLVLPPAGVYAAHAFVLEESGSNAAARSEVPPLRAVLNIGVRPTLGRPVPELRLEAHLLDFSGNLYGRELELAFVAALRPEQRFASLDELREQIARDITQARSLFD